MRINMYQNGEAGAQDLSNSEGVATGPIVLTRDPVLPMEAVPKQYVDAAVTTLSASNITSGILSPAFMPAYTGDATSAAGSTSFTLAASGVTPGRYTKVTVDAKGRVTSGSNILESDLPNMSWSDIQLDKPNTLTGYGITDALRNTGGTLTQNLVLSATPTAANHAATKGYLDSVVAAGAAVQIPVGNIAQMPLTQSTVGYLRCNGAAVSKTTYAALYAVVGDIYNISSINGSGKPWQQQYDVNVVQATDITGWTTGTSLPAATYSGSAFVTKNRAYLVGGRNASVRVAGVYSAPINADGTLGTWSASTPLPGVLGLTQAIVTKNRVYLIGGMDVTTVSAKSTVYTAPINTDGTLGTWAAGNQLPTVLAYSQVIATINRVYVLGGMDQNGIDYNTVYTAVINTDGTLGAWSTGTSLPATIVTSQAIVTKNRVYLIGGSVGGNVSSTVYTAPINSDGTLGTWAAGTSLPVTIDYSTSIVTRNRVYLLGGRVSGTQTSTVYTAPINTDGTLGTWAAGTSLPGVLCHSQPIVTKNRVYLLGGVNSVLTQVVYTAPILEGLNDYSSYYDGTLSQTPATNFALPNLEAYATPNTAYFIKT